MIPGTRTEFLKPAEQRNGERESDDSSFFSLNGFVFGEFDLCRCEEISAMHARTRRWSFSDAGTDEKSSNNMPIAIADDDPYRSIKLRLNANDIVNHKCYFHARFWLWKYKKASKQNGCRVVLNI